MFQNKYSVRSSHNLFSRLGKKNFNSGIFLALTFLLVAGTPVPIAVGLQQHLHATSDPLGTAWTDGLWQDGLGNDAFPNDTTNIDEDFDIISKLRDNDNSYTEIYNPWKTRAANHVAAVTDDGEFMAVGGGFLLDTEVHIYRWNVEIEEYEKVWEAGSGEIQGDVYDLAFGDFDNNELLDLVAVSGDGFVYVFEQAFLYDPFESLENRFDLVWKSDKLFQAKSVEVDDVDRDGITDIIVGSWDSRVHIFEYTDRSGYPFALEHWIEFEEKWVSDELDGKVESVETGDFNGNGLPDIIAGTFTGEIYIFENDGVLVPTPNNELAPLPNDDNYRLIWSQTESEKTIWKTIGSIEAEDIDGDGFTDAVLMGWGQGAWMLKYTEARGFYLEQLMVPFEDFEERGFYPLDYFGDRLVTDDTDPFVTPTNLFVDTDSRSQHSCSVNREPTGDGSCYSVLVNSAATDIPDGVYTEFRPNATATAFGVWNMGVGEEIATNGNSDPDLYIVMPTGQVTPADWNITLSNNLQEWFTVEPVQFSVVTGSEDDALAVDLDVLFSLREIESMQYIRLELINQNAQGDVDAFVVPYPSRPLTLAVSANIYPLSFLEDGLFVQPTNKIIFGGTDGRLIVFDQVEMTELGIRDKTNFSLPFATIADTDYGLKLQTWSQKWDSFKDDQFKTDETIWSIYPTPKGTVVPIWRYYTGGPMDDFNLNNIGTGTTKAHFMLSHDINPFFSGTELIVSSNATAELTVFSDYYENNAGDVNSLTNTFFTNHINNYYNDNSPDKILTFTFGEFDSDYFLEEIITLGWFEDPSVIGTSIGNDDYITPIMWSYNGTGYGEETELIEETTQLYNFLASSFTYPSADTGDFNNDGLTDIVISNGRLAILWNTGTASDPKFELDQEYFATLNEKALSLPIYQPNAWDYDADGDYDILYSYGRDNNSRQRYGLDFFENRGSLDQPDYERTPEIVKNPLLSGSFFANDFTYGSVDTDTPSDATAYAIWVYNPETHSVRQTFAEIGSEASFIVGSNPEIKKLEVNKAQTDFYINYGYTVTESWNNRYEFADWTMTLQAGELDDDSTIEIIVGDYDNNVYVFENLVNNTYKRAFKTFDLNHTRTSDTTPFIYDGIVGLTGKFTRTVFDHATDLIVGIDLNANGLREFMVVSDLSIYIFENTGFNDAYRLIFERDYGQEISTSDQEWDSLVDTFSAVAYTPDFDGRGPMIALGADYQLFLLRYSTDIGFVESYAAIDNNNGIIGMFGTPSEPLNHIDVLRFSDINQDGQTELWAGGYTSVPSSEVRNGFLVALESNYSNYMLSYTFSSDFLLDNPINTIEIDDLDYDGQLELLVGHTFGVDIYEASIGNLYEFNRVSVISSDPGYAASVPDERFGSINSPDPLGARKHDMMRLSNGKYVIVMGEDQVSNSWAQFDESPTNGILRYAWVDDPSDLTDVDNYPRVGSDPLSETGAASERVVFWESEPSIIEGATPGSFYITWVSYYQNYASSNPGTIRYNAHIQEFNSAGSPLGSQQVWITNGLINLIRTPSIALQPSDTADILFAAVYSDILYTYDINFDAGGSVFTIDSARSSYTLELDYFFHSVDMVSDTTSGKISIALSAKAWNGGITYKTYYAEYLDNIHEDDFQGIWLLNTDGVQEVYPSILVMPNDASNIIIMYERLKGGTNIIATSFSSESGRTWSDVYSGFTKNGNLTQIDEFKYLTLEGLTVYPRQYRPQMTIDANGFIEYQFVERFVIFSGAGGDSNYNDVTFFINFFGSTLNYQFATQMFTAEFENSNFFSFKGISNVRDIAIGDSDKDGRRELFLSHGTQVSLIETSSVSSNQITFTTKFQSEKYLRDTGAVEIFDTNNNGIPELIYTVLGGDVIFLELTNLRQPAIDDYYIVEKVSAHTSTPVTSVRHVVAANVDVDTNPEYITASLSTSGTVELVDDNGADLEEANIGVVTDLYYENQTVIVVNRTRIYGLDTALNIIYNYPIKDTGELSNHLITDIDNDGSKELVILQNTTILAVEITTGALIFSQSLVDAESTGFTDLSSTIIDNKQYFSVATTNADRFTVHLLDENGSLIDSSSIYYFNTTSDKISHEIGDFDGDGEIEIALHRYWQSSLSFLQMYDPTQQDLFHVQPTSNISLSTEGAALGSAPDILSMDTKGDGIADIILHTNNGTLVNLPQFSTPALLAIDLSSGTIIWYRSVPDTIDDIELQNLESGPSFVIRTSSSGTFVLDLEGTDLFWLDTHPTISDVSLVDLPTTVGAVATNQTGYTDLYTTTGILSVRQNIITLKTNKVVPETIQFYKLSDVSLASYSKPVDINRDGASDLFVGFSNGTFALRNYDLGEYWRVDVDNIDSIHAEAIRYAPNQNGLAISYDPGYLVIFDRISTRAVINVSNSFGAQEILDMKTLSPDGQTDYLLIRTKLDAVTTGFHLFNPIQQSFVWNYTTGGVFDKFEIANLDNNQPFYPTHIVYGIGTISLIPLPTTLLPSGNLPPANDADTWIDYKVVTTSEGLSSFYLVSTSGDFAINTYRLGDTTLYEEVQLGLSGITHFSMFQTSGTSYYLFENTTASHLYIDAGSLNLVVNLTQSIFSTDELNMITDFNQGGDPEILLFARNELAIYDLSGELLELRSFSSSVISHQNWYPDQTGDVVLTTDVFNENIEIIDPVKRNFSSYLAPVSDIEDISFVYEEVGEFIPPDGSWTEYPEIPVDEEQNTPMLLLVGVPILLATIAIIIRRAKL